MDAAVAAAAANPGSARVPGFLPSVNGLHFINAWPHEPDLTIALPGVGTLPIGDASSGVCGGMVYAVRDVFQTPGMAPVAATDNPPPDAPLFCYIVARLLESFDVGHLGFARYYEWMLTPDADATVGPLLARRVVKRGWTLQPSQRAAARRSPGSTGRQWMAAAPSRPSNVIAPSTGQTYWQSRQPTQYSGSTSIEDEPFVPSIRIAWCAPSLQAA